MAELDEINDSIKDNLNSLEVHINKSPLFNTNPSKWAKQYSQYGDQIQNDIISLQLQIAELPSNQSSHYANSIKSFKKKQSKLEQDYQKKLHRDSSSNFNMQRNNILKTPQQKRINTIEEVISKGDQSLQNTKGVVLSLNQMVQRGNTMALQVNLQLNKQIQQLTVINDTVKDTQSSLDRAKKNITYFLKALECDKCMMLLLALIILAFVAVIALAIKNDQG